MDKLQIAHDWAMKHGNGKTWLNRKDMVEHAWEYADAMQEEANKRKEAGLPEAIKCHLGKNQEEWQPDWSQAPDGFNWFCVGCATNHGYFCNIEPKIIRGYYWMCGEDVIVVDSFGYQGDWEHSLRKRPD